jgi:hypothetical protein
MSGRGPPSVRRLSGQAGWELLPGLPQRGSGASAGEAGDASDAPSSARRGQDRRKHFAPDDDALAPLRAALPPLEISPASTRSLPPAESDAEDVWSGEEDGLEYRQRGRRDERWRRTPHRRSAARHPLEAPLEAEITMIRSYIASSLSLVADLRRLAIEHCK